MYRAMNTVCKSLKTVVTFTFHDNKKLGDAFVAALKELYGNDNVCQIDQSTYGVNDQQLTIDNLYSVLYKAEEKSEKHKKEDEIHVLYVIKEHQNILCSSIGLQQRLGNV